MTLFDLFFSHAKTFNIFKYSESGKLIEIVQVDKKTALAHVLRNIKK